MHEFITFDRLNNFHVAIFQSIFFIVTYQAFYVLQDYLSLSGALVVIFWLTSSYKEWSLFVCCFLGWFLAICNIHASKRPPSPVNSNHLIYYLVQPSILFFLMPVYVPQTNYPIGIVLSFFVWVGVHIVLWQFSGSRNDIWGLLCIHTTPTIVFILLFYFPTTPWLAISVAFGLTYIFVVLVHKYFQAKKSL